MPAITTPLKNYRILIVDADIELAKVLRDMLAEMGFTNVATTRSGREAIKQLRNVTFDFIITEWNTQHMDGLAMLKFIRRDPLSPDPTIPVIMLTGRAEEMDVTLARDYGINEYVVKPFTARTIYNRLERIIEQPRNFIMAETFVGPDRRSKSEPPAGVKERRANRIAPKAQPEDMRREMQNTKKLPQVWLPDFSLKLKLGKDVKLQDFVTPAILEQSQSAIDALASDSLKWIRENIEQLTNLYDRMGKLDCPADISASISETALTVNSRAGTFGFKRASEIAYALYLFSRNKLDPKNPDHHLVLRKHIEVLKVMLGNQLSGDGGEVGAQIANQLTKLAQKYG